MTLAKLYIGDVCVAWYLKERGRGVCWNVKYATCFCQRPLTNFAAYQQSVPYGCLQERRLQQFIITMHDYDYRMSDGEIPYSMAGDACSSCMSAYTECNDGLCASE